MADTNTQPPKLKPYREMGCITKLNNEVVMIKNYIANKKIRNALTLQNEMMLKIPEVQKRLTSRKLGY